MLWAQAPDPAYAPLDRAYAALRAKQYDQAITGFQQAVTIAPVRAAIRKDLAYTLLKVGETVAAREQFAEAMFLDAGDDQVALEYAFLCYETKEPVEARRVFDRLRKKGNATAAQAFGDARHGILESDLDQNTSTAIGDTASQAYKAALDAAMGLVPEARNASLLSARVGLRPRTPDGLPVIGWSAAVPGVMYATGHYRNGVLLAPLTAHLVVDAMLGTPDDGALALTAPSRFGRL